MCRFMYDCRSNHFRRLGKDETGAEFATRDGRTEGPDGAGKRQYPDALEIANETIVAHPIVRLNEAKCLLDTPELGILTPKPNPHPVNLSAIAQTQQNPFCKRRPHFWRHLPSLPHAFLDIH